MRKLKICLIGKYPPHKGGTAAANYWFARALGESGHEVHVVTDPTEKEKNYLHGMDEGLLADLQPKNVFLHEAEPAASLNSKTCALASLAVDVIEKNSIELIYSKYFIPYGVAGFLAKTMTGKPLVLMHAGSDLAFLRPGNAFEPLAAKLLQNADKIVMSAEETIDFKRLGLDKKKIALQSDFGLNLKSISKEKTKAFLEKNGLPKGKPIIGLFGKTAHKGIGELFEALAEIKNKDFLLLAIPEDDREREAIRRQAAEKGIGQKTIVLGYQPPWELPSVYNSLAALVATEVGFPVKAHTPLAAIEALYLGKCTVISEETSKKPFFRQFKDCESILVVNPKDTGAYAKKLKWVLEHAGESEKIGQNAKKTQGLLDGKKFVEKFAELFLETAGECEGKSPTEKNGSAAAGQDSWITALKNQSLD
ncbi:MAG: glycosyltransferase family 4 protein [Candidatus Diapherotrites archaeon]